MDLRQSFTLASISSYSVQIVLTYDRPGLPPRHFLGLCLYSRVGDVHSVPLAGPVCSHWCVMVITTADTSPLPLPLLRYVPISTGWKP
jgi:hypothetical protein